MSGFAHIIVAFNGDNNAIASRVAEKIIELAGKGCRKFHIYVIHDAPRPYYINTLRNVITNNIAFTITVWYKGSSPSAIDDIATRIRGEPIVAVISRDLDDVIEKARSYGIEYIVV